MNKMKRIFPLLLCGVLVFGMAGSVQAQSKKTSSKGKTTTAKKKKPVAPPAPKVVELPYGSNDCLFAIPLELDKEYGPTTAPDGGGRVQEVMADKRNPNLFEREHNSVWYKVTIPYNGQLEILISQANEWNDYDFLVYKNTGSYFSNQVMQNKVLPVAVNLAAVDSNAMAAANLAARDQRKPKAKAAAPGEKANGTPAKNSQAKSGTSARNTKAAETPAFDLPAEFKPTIGMLHDATDRMLTKKQFGKFIKSIPVRMGEEYYIVLDNTAYNGEGHTIKVSVYVDAYEPLVLFYDRKARKYVDVDLMILERGGQGGERPLIRDEHFRGGKVKFVPGFNYTLYAKRDGYFSIYKDFNAASLMARDTLMVYNMERTERGTTFDLRDIAFEVDEAKLVSGSDTALMNYVAMFRNHPDVNFTVKGFVQSYGVNAEADMLLSLERAKTIKEFLVRHGIDAKRISTAGMTRNEIKRAAAAALDDKGFSNVKAQIIITGKEGQQ